MAISPGGKNPCLCYLEPKLWGKMWEKAVRCVGLFMCVGDYPQSKPSPDILTKPKKVIHNPQK